VRRGRRSASRCFSSVVAAPDDGDGTPPYAVAAICGPVSFFLWDKWASFLFFSRRKRPVVVVLANPKDSTGHQQSHGPRFTNSRWVSQKKKHGGRG
jgi:hypothetical protein